MNTKSIFTITYTVLLLLTGIHSTFANKPKVHFKHNEREIKSTNNAPSEYNLKAINITSAECNASLWRYVYNPSRLLIIDSCIIITGIIKESKAEKDGDQHLLLKLDAGQDELLNKKNIKKKSNDLVLEVVCANNITLKKAKKTCKGYINNVQLPSVGEHVKVMGSYIIDSHNGWAEIHPVTKIEVIK